MSIAIIIQQFLALDVVDGTAAAVSARNSNIWPSPSQVPDYAYKSLGTLWCGHTVSSSQLITRINYQFGEGNTAPEGEISIYTLPAESTVLNSIGFDSNLPGAETAYLDFVLRKPEGESSVARMVNVELRLRYLLDQLWRGKRRGGGIVPTPPNLPVIGDTSISQALPVICQWYNYSSVTSATEVGVRYCISYYRNVPT